MATTQWAKSVQTLKTNNGTRESDDLDTDIGRLYGTWYMENVDTSKGPLSEAAFLDHASNITIFGSDGEVDLSSLDDRPE